MGHLFSPIQSPLNCPNRQPTQKSSLQPIPATPLLPLPSIDNPSFYTIPCAPPPQKSFPGILKAKSPSPSSSLLPNLNRALLKFSITGEPRPSPAFSSSSSKKPTPKAKPSQSSKFGIQHFLDRHLATSENPKSSNHPLSASTTPPD
ncbi:hypothetical protein Drorol1_Dr00024765 [Drosera rotundifolia]